MKHSMKRAIVIGIAGAIAFGEAAPSFAAPVPSSTVAVKMAAPDMLDQVRSRRGRGGAVGAGIALGVIGAIVGATAAQSYYGPGYYGGPDYYGPGYYGGPGYGPGYYDHPGFYAAPVFRRGHGCWVVTDRDRNYGYWGRCR